MVNHIALKNSNGQPGQNINYPEVQEYLQSFIRNSSTSPTANTYGYDIYLSSPMYGFLRGKGIDRPEQYTRQISPFFMEAAWGLCQRGILRPGVTSENEQATEQGNAGMGFSFTLFGKQWLEEKDDQDVFPSDLSSYGVMISEFESIFGVGFIQRANEALRCYLSHAYFACCAMTGAAAESIALHLAIKADGDEEKIIQKYEKPGGRVEILKIISQDQNKNNVRQLESYFSLLAYWRDSSSHSTKVNVDSNEAYSSILLLVRFAIFAKAHIGG